MDLGRPAHLRQELPAEVRYLGTRGVHLDTQVRINRITQTSPTLFLPTYLTNPGQPALDALTTTLDVIKPSRVTVGTSRRLGSPQATWWASCPSATPSITG